MLFRGRKETAPLTGPETQRVFTQRDLARYLWRLGKSEFPGANPTSLIFEPPLTDIGPELLRRTLTDSEKRERIIWLRSDGVQLGHGEEIFVVGPRGGAPYPDHPPPGWLTVGTGHSHSGSCLPSPEDVGTVLSAKHEPPLGLEIIFGTDGLAVLLASSQTRRFSDERLARLIRLHQERERIVFSLLRQAQPDLKPEAWRRCQWRSVNFFCSQFGVLLFTQNCDIIG